MRKPITLLSAMCLGIIAGCDDGATADPAQAQVHYTAPATVQDAPALITELTALEGAPHFDPTRFNQALQASWWSFTPGEGQYNEESLVLTNGCGELRFGPPEESNDPDPSGPSTRLLPTISEASSSGFVLNFTPEGKLTPTPGAPVDDVACDLWGMVFQCDAVITEVRGDSGLFMALLGQTFDAVFQQTSDLGGLFLSNASFIGASRFTSECIGSDCQAFIPAIQGLLGIQAQSLIECSPVKTLKSSALVLEAP